MQWTVNQQYIVSVEASLILLGCEGRLTYAEMRVVSTAGPTQSRPCSALVSFGRAVC